MQDPTLVNGGGDRDAQGTGSGEELTTQQMLGAAAKILGVDATGMNEEQEWRIQQEARNLVSDIQQAIDDELPSATLSQVSLIVEGIVKTDTVRIIHAVRDALQIDRDMQAIEKRLSAGALKVQGTGDSNGGQQESPRNMGEAVVNASHAFG